LKFSRKHELSMYLVFNNLCYISVQFHTTILEDLAQLEQPELKLIRGWVNFWSSGIKCGIFFLGRTTCVLIEGNLIKLYEKKGANFPRSFMGELEWRSSRWWWCPIHTKSPIKILQCLVAASFGQRFWLADVRLTCRKMWHVLPPGHYLAGQKCPTAPNLPWFVCLSDLCSHTPYAWAQKITKHPHGAEYELFRVEPAAWRNVAVGYGTWLTPWSPFSHFSHSGLRTSDWALSFHALV